MLGAYLAFLVLTVLDKPDAPRTPEQVPFDCSYSHNMEEGHWQQCLHPIVLPNGMLINSDTWIDYVGGTVTVRLYGYYED